MAFTKIVLVLVCLMSTALVAQEAKVTVMQVRGGKEVTLTPGQTFYEGPDDIHIVGRNAGKAKPAKPVVFFVKSKGAPILVPAK